MPLRLKSLELHGYKTFAAKTVFEFAEGITAIVGPNGSGKSNIADALRWVLGEQSYSLLRAKKTEDMIFAGSEHRTRAGMASAGITFDNVDGWLPVDFSEVALSRRSYRDGRNEYLLNSQHVRLKDINELLAQSGLSERTYTILGQGLVDASLALKADERRRLFEEAAGIGLYRARREEALRRLDATKRNLDRVLDILAELEPRLKSLERQAARAQDYAQVQSDLRILMLDWYGFHWHRAQQDLAEALEKDRAQDVKLAQARDSFQQVHKEFIIFREHLNNVRARLNSWHRQSAQLHESRETISGSLAALDERQRALLENRQSSLGEQSDLSIELETAQARLNETAAEIVRFQKEYEESQAQARQAQTVLADRQAERSRLEVDLQSIRVKMNEFTTRHASLQARKDELSGRIENLNKKRDPLDQSIAKAKAEAENAAREHKEATTARQFAEKSFQKVEAELLDAKKKQADLEARLKEKQAARSNLLAEQAGLKAQMDVLEQSEQSLAGYADGAKLLLDAFRQSKLAGARGALSARLDVPAELEVAVAAALGEYTDAVLFDSGRDAEQAMSLLDSDQSGRAALLPLDWLSPGEPLKFNRNVDCLGVASDLVKIASEYRPALDLLLGHVLIVRDRAAARGVLAGQPKNTLAVTLQGDVFHATGQVTAGKPAKTAALGRLRQRRELQGGLSNIEQQIVKWDLELESLSGLIESGRADLADRQVFVDKEHTGFDKAREKENQSQIREESAQRQWDWLISQRAALDAEAAQAELELGQADSAFVANEKDSEAVRESMRTVSVTAASISTDEFQEQARFWATSLAVAERAESDARLRLAERTQAVERLQEQQTAIENRLAEVDKSLSELESTRKNLRVQASGINTQLEELRNLIDPAEKELETSEMHETDLQKQETEGQFALARIERTNNQIQLDLSRKQESLANLRRKIEDDFGLVIFEYANEVSGPVPLPLDGMVEQLPLVKEIPADLEESMARLRAQLRRMGAVNPEAMQEYHTVKERLAFLKTQLEDLHKAEADLHKVIAELDELTRHEFLKTFEAVAVQFHAIFHRLFGGGSARLVLTDPENLTDTGIDIEAQLPGRREQGLSLLSGGERSLTAIALVFSLLKVSPTPLCVLDEVDAMLDEANVGRFRDLLLELSKETQFIIITHNRNTVQAADVIYGVTMGRDSASQIISLKLDEISDDYLK